MTTTGRGRGVLIAGAVLAMVGTWLGYPETAAVGAAAVAAVVLSLESGRRLPDLTVTRTVEPALVMRGQPCHVVLEVSCEASRTSRLTASTLTAEDGVGERRVVVPLATLRPGATTTVRYDVPTEGRGPVRVGPLWIGRRDPFGLTGAGRSYVDDAVVKVYPRLHHIVALPAALRRGAEGDSGPRPGDAAVSDQLRKYTTGDDRRQVHWRSSARLGGLMVRERADTGRPGLVVLLDDRAGAHRDDTFESACEAAGSIVAAALREGTPVRLVTAGGAEMAGRRELTGHLSLLAEARLRSPDQPDHGLARATAGQLTRAGDVLVGLTGPDDVGVLSALRRRDRSTLVVVFGGTPVLGEVRGGARLLGVRDGADFAARWPTAWA